MFQKIIDRLLQGKGAPEPAGPGPKLVASRAGDVSRYEARCRGGGIDIRAAFGDLADDELWNALLLKEYDGFATIKALLPDWPSADLQRAWVGNAGYPLSVQTLAFYRTVKEAAGRLGTRPLGESRLLDFGCGWGRIIRYFAKDVPAAGLCGCDVEPGMLDICRQLRVPGDLRVSDPLPERLPFDEPFDLVYAYSVFTHLSERAHLACLEAIHRSMAPGGILVATVRPRGFLELKAAWPPSLSDGQLGRLRDEYDAGRYAYVPHNIPPIDGDVPYGDCCVPTAYIRTRWDRWFEYLETGSCPGDPNQVPMVFRRR
jgi:SAM-dependent methyltransferase